jgi:hypothetical protein
MTNYERICQDKVFCASVLSEALNHSDYEDDDYDYAVTDFLNAETMDGKNERRRSGRNAK